MRSLVLVLVLLGCDLGPLQIYDSGLSDAGQPDIPDPPAPDGGFLDKDAALDLGQPDNSQPDLGPPDLGLPDTGPPLVDAGPQPYSCAPFTMPAQALNTATGFRASLVAEGDSFEFPSALVFAGGDFSDQLYAINQRRDQILSIDPRTGAVSVFVDAADWPVPVERLGSLVWDASGQFDGALYAGDLGLIVDGDSRIFRISPQGVPEIFADPPAPGLDDVFSLAFSSGQYPLGLMAAGDTDGDTAAAWGLFDQTGQSAVFSSFEGSMGIAIDPHGLYGGLLFAAHPRGAGFSGDGSVRTILPGGIAGPPLVSDLAGVHSLVFSPGGAFGELLYGASFGTRVMGRVHPDGSTDEIATNARVSPWDGTVIAFSPDGNALFMAEANADRIVCIEPDE